MNTAIVFVDKKDGQDLAMQRIIDKTLLGHTVNRLKRGGSQKTLVVSKEKWPLDDVIFLDDVRKIRENIEDEAGRVIITGIHYPAIESDVYHDLFNISGAGVVMNGGKTLDIFAMESRDFIHYDKLKYEAYNLKEEITEVKSAEDVVAFAKNLHKEINHRHLLNGVSFVDIDKTYIGEDVEIAKGVCLYPDVYLEGETKIGKNTTITAGSHLIDATVGEDCNIMASRIDNSILHNKVKLGPNSHLRMHCEIADGCRIGNYVEFKNTRFGKISRAAHLTYLGDADVGEDVNIGCGVITVNYDGAHKFKTVIKDKAFIGSNSNIIAPVTVGYQALVAAGSTVTRDVADGAMAIGRVRQEDKPGFGYRYITKEK